MTLSRVVGIGVLLAVAPMVAAGQSDSRGLPAAYEAFKREDFRRSEELARSVWQEAESGNDPVQAGLAAAQIGAALAIDGRIDDALEWYAEASTRLETAGEARAEGRVAVARALSHYLSKDIEAGDRELARARELLDADDWRIAYVDAAFHLWAQLERDPALHDFENLVERSRDQEPTQLAAVLSCSAWIAGAWGETGRSVALYSETEKIYAELGDARAAALARRNGSVARLRSGNLDRASVSLRAAAEMARQASDLRLEFIVLNDLGVALAQAGDQPGAEEVDRQAESTLARLAEEIRQGRLQDTPMVDYYHLLRMRYLDKPGFVIDPFPWLLDQLAIDPAIVGGPAP